MRDKTKGVVVVVHNSFFEAAGFAFDIREFEGFTHYADTRPKEFVIIPRDIACKLSGYIEEDTLL